jgi:hypothetical protein
MHALAQRDLIQLIGRHVRADGYQKQQSNEKKESDVGDAVLFEAPPGKAPAGCLKIAGIHQILTLEMSNRATAKKFISPRRQVIF